MRILIIGGVAAGASAATKARRTNEDAEIVIFEQGPYVSFANCGLPYYVGGVIEDREDLILVSPEMFKARFNIDVRTNCQVTSIDTDSKCVTVLGENGEVKEAYDKLILAMGGAPIRPNIDGMSLPQVYNVFTVPDADKIVESIGSGVKSAVVVGGGFIGIETAESLAGRGIKTTLVEMKDQLLSNFDAEFSPPVERSLESLGVDIRLGRSVASIKGSTKVEAAVLDNGDEITCDMVILAVGVYPRIELVQNTKIALGTAGGILTDASMETSVKDVYAAGDIVESLHLVSGKKVRIPLAGSANKQGRVAGCNAAGGNMLFRGVQGTAIIKAGELTCARTGLNERECIALCKEYDTVLVPTNSSATYYPGAEFMIIKVTYEKFTGTLLGAQIIGKTGVDKRIDVFATAIYARLTVFDLENLDLAYAPPYASAKDPVVMTGMVAANVIRGIVPTVSPKQADEMVQNGAVLLDVRSPEELAEEGDIPGAINLPVDTLRARYTELDAGKPVVVYCGVGYRAYVSCRFLLQKGFDVYNLSGGYYGYNMDV